MKTDPKSIIGKTITGVIARPSASGLPAVMVLQFSDGSCFEFVSPAARRTVARHTGKRRAEQGPVDSLLASQLTIFPTDGESSAHPALPAAAA